MMNVMKSLLIFFSSSNHILYYMKMFNIVKNTKKNKMILSVLQILHLNFEVVVLIIALNYDKIKNM